MRLSWNRAQSAPGGNGGRLPSPVILAPSSWSALSPVRRVRAASSEAIHRGPRARARGSVGSDLCVWLRRTQWADAQLVQERRQHQQRERHQVEHARPHGELHLGTRSRLVLRTHCAPRDRHARGATAGMY